MACIAPNKLADGTEVACRECKQCQLKAKNDWIGRNIAESKTNKFCYIITATYGRGRVGESLHERAVILTYSDVQKFLKLLRRHGYECRAFITGEYGSERQRAHWNIILYSQKPLPSFSGWDQFGKWKAHMSYKRRFNWVRTDKQGNPVYLQNGEPAWLWPHGFVHVDAVTIPGVKYCCKYVLKDLDSNGKQGKVGQSRNPPIGAVWFHQLAEKYVEQGLAPQTPVYRHPESRTKDGEVINYWMKGRTLELYLQHYIDAWAKRWPDRPRPRSEYVDLFEEYGKVVNDEAAMLLRQEFPRGESRAPIPTGPQIKKGGEQAMYERASMAYSLNSDAMEKSDNGWIERAPDGQERQRRQQIVARQRERNWTKFNHQWGRHAFAGGWLLPTDSTGPCTCCAVGVEQREPVGQRDRANPQPGRLGEPERLGPIGKYNRDHSAGPRNNV